MNVKVKLEINTDIPPVCELEQVSPDSEKSHSNDTRKPLVNANFKNCHMYEYFDSKNDDLESPAFEPIGTETKLSCNDDDMDISDGDDMPNQMNEVKSNVSSISGLTSNESNNSPSPLSPSAPQPLGIAQYGKSLIEENSSDLVIDQDSVLSLVSSETSTSRLSIVTNNNTNSPENTCNHINATNCGANVDCLYGISEETQMQKFNECSSSNESSINFFYNTNTGQFSKDQETERSHFELNASAKTEENSGISNEGKVDSSVVVGENKQSSICKYKHQRLQKSQSNPVHEQNILPVSYY